jgi:hypothetical protein
MCIGIPMSARIDKIERLSSKGDSGRLLLDHTVPMIFMAQRTESQGRKCKVRRLAIKMLPAAMIQV